MASTVQTIITVPKADFVASGGEVNNSIFLQELKDASLSVVPWDVSQVSTTAKITLTGLAVAGDLTAVNAAVVAHAGDAFAAESQRAVANVQQTTDAVSIDAVTLSSGPLRAGSYNLFWYAEHGPVASAVSQLAVHGQISGGSETELGFDTSGDAGDYKAFSGTYTLESVKDGESVSMRLAHSRKSGTGNVVVRRARLFLKLDNG